MGTPLLQKLGAAAAADAGLQAILGTNPFRWYDFQLLQGTAFPAVTQQLVDDPQGYAINGRMPTSWARVQLNLWAADKPTIESLTSALYSFLDGFTASGVPASSHGNPTLIVGARDRNFPQKDPPYSLRIIDVKILDNDLV